MIISWDVEWTVYVIWIEIQVFFGNLRAAVVTFDGLSNQCSLITARSSQKHLNCAHFVGLFDGAFIDPQHHQLLFSQKKKKKKKSVKVSSL